MLEGLVDEKVDEEVVEHDGLGGRRGGGGRGGEGREDAGGHEGGVEVGGEGEGGVEAVVGLAEVVGGGEADADGDGVEQAMQLEQLEAVVDGLAGGEGVVAEVGAHGVDERVGDDAVGVLLEEVQDEGVLWGVEDLEGERGGCGGRCGGRGG